MLRFVAALIVLPFFSTAVAAEARLALVVGNSAYAHISRLKNPTNDAALMRGNLAAFGYSVDFITNATRDQFRAAFAAFAKKYEAAGKAASTIIYFAGHGVQVDGVNYLLPVDANMTTPGDVKRDAHNVGNLATTLNAIQAREGSGTILFLLDACSNNPFSSDLEIGRSRGLSGADIKGIVDGSKRVFYPEDINWKGRMLIATASDPGTTAMDGDGQNSPYALALTRVLQQSWVDINLLLRQTRVEVGRLTDGAQKPWVYGVPFGTPDSMGFNKQQ